MTGRPGRRSGMARWGWIGVVVNLLCVLANVAALIWLNGGWLNVGAIVFCGLLGVSAHRDWRKAIDRHYTTSQWVGR